MTTEYKISKLVRYLNKKPIAQSIYKHVSESDKPVSIPILDDIYRRTNCIQKLLSLKAIRQTSKPFHGKFSFYEADKDLYEIVSKSIDFSLVDVNDYINNST